LREFEIDVALEPIGVDYGVQGVNYQKDKQRKKHIERHPWSIPIMRSRRAARRLWRASFLAAASVRQIGGIERLSTARTDHGSCP
jgi:hypothetical protein